MVVMTLVTIPLMDRVGRRTLHLVGLVGIIVCSIMITIALNYSNNDNERSIIEEKATGVGIFLVVATLSFVVFFALGPGSIPWMAAGEMFSQGPRAPAISVCVFTNWLANLIVGLVFPQLQTHLQNYSFLPFLLISAILFAILFFYFTETKGKTANEVAYIYQAPGAWTTFIGNQKGNDTSGISPTSPIELSTTQM